MEQGTDQPIDQNAVEMLLPFFLGPDLMTKIFQFAQSDLLFFPVPTMRVTVAASRPELH